MEIITEKLSDNQTHSLFYYGKTIAKHILPNGNTVYLETAGEQCLITSTRKFENDQLTDHAIKYCFTDKKILNLRQNDKLSSENWFTITELDADGNINEDSELFDSVFTFYDEAIAVFQKHITNQ